MKSSMRKTLMWGGVILLVILFIVFMGMGVKEGFYFFGEKPDNQQMKQKQAKQQAKMQAEIKQMQAQRQAKMEAQRQAKIEAQMEAQMEAQKGKPI